MSGILKTSVEPVAGRRGRVVLLHGLGCNSWLMSLLALRLQSCGYQVENWGYWSVWQSLEQLIPQFEEKFVSVQDSLEPDEPLYIVGHSMGSIIARAVMARVPLPAMRRAVMLSPPNSGSHVATALGPRLRWLTALVDELSDRSDSLVNGLPRTVTAEVGVIAAAWDYVVREQSTHLEGETDHIVIPSRHTGLVLRKSAADQIIHFLDYGLFHRDACPCCGCAAVESAAQES